MTNTSYERIRAAVDAAVFSHSNGGLAAGLTAMAWALLDELRREPEPELPTEEDRTNAGDRFFGEQLVRTSTRQCFNAGWDAALAAMRERNGR